MSRVKRPLRTMLIAVLTAYTIIVVLALAFSDRMMFQPPRSSYTARSLPITSIPVDGATLAALYLPNPAARYTILYSHGNAEDLGYVAPQLQQLHDAGFAVLGYDYRGYGTSTGGPPTTRKATEDAAAAYDYAVRVLGIPPERIVLFGFSVGSGPTMELAALRPVAGVILQSPFKSAFTVVTVVPILPFDRFPNLKHIRQLRAPVLIIHGTRDAIIPFRHGIQLYDAAPGPKQHLWVEGADHNDVVSVAGSQYTAALASFAELLDGRQHAR
jgi:abhydrolase domain-containing protein 17